MLLMLLGAVVPARERENQRVFALQPAQACRVCRRDREARNQESCLRIIMAL